jgi:hydroxymethylpyrimidine pyrophosphatase-like HAD family hydrolase
MGTTRISAVVADLDGTLVGRDFSVSKLTVDALQMLEAEEIPFVVATGRTPQGVELLSDITPHVRIAVCCSGAIGSSLSDNRTLWMEMFDDSLTRKVVEVAVAFGAGVASFDGRIWRMNEEYDRLSPGQPRGPMRMTVPASELVERPCCSMAIRVERAGLMEIRDRRSADVNAASSLVGDSIVLDVMPSGVDKGTGAIRALDLLGVDPTDAISFGDMPNDLPLFAATARSYAIGRSDPVVTGSVHEVLAGVEQDGFGRKILQLAESGWRLD